MTTVELGVPLTLRPLAPDDLPNLDWTGGPEHLRHLADLIGQVLAGQATARVAVLPSGRLVGMGAVDLGQPPAATVWMLAVRESWQSLGIGSLLVRALEADARDAGRTETRIQVEHDNPRAAALYTRLGYRPYGSGLDRWSVAGNRTYVTVCTLMRRPLDIESPRPG